MAVGSLILNPRGTGGSGKTELVRRLIDNLACQGSATGRSLQPVYRDGRKRPIAYQLRYESSGYPVVVLGHYERRSGGCDTIRQADGGIREVFRLAERFASEGSRVVMEGLRLSSDHALSGALAAKYPFHILRLTTPLDECVRNLVKRRRLSRSAWPLIRDSIAEEQEQIARACNALSGQATVHQASFDEAIRIAHHLLGVR